MITVTKMCCLLEWIKTSRLGKWQRCTATPFWWGNSCTAFILTFPFPSVMEIIMEIYNGNPLQPTSSTVNPCSLAASVQKQPLALTAFSSSPLCVSVVLHHHLLLLLHHHHLHSFHPVRVYGKEVLSKSGLLYNDSFFCPSVHKHRIKQQGT